MSRACSSAIAASAACRLPTCLWLSPARLRTNTSYRGQSFSLMPASSGRAPALFLGVCLRRFAHPASFFVRLPACRHALRVARSVAGDHVVELLPVDLAMPVVTGFRIPAQIGIRHLQAEVVSLRNGDVDELLAQLVVAEAFDLPSHGLRAVLRVRVARTKHHERRPPPAIERVLCHR